MWYHQIHDQDFYSKEVDVYKEFGRFVLLFNSKQKGNLYEFYLFFWENFLRKIYFEVNHNWPFIEEYVKGKEFEYYDNILRKINTNEQWTLLSYHEVIIPNKVYVEEEGEFFEDISIYDERNGENIWTKKWTFKIWDYCHIKRHFLIWINNSDIFAYNIYKKKYEKLTEVVFSDWDVQNAGLIKYKDNFIYDNSNKRQDTDVLCLMNSSKYLNDLKEFFKDWFSYKNLVFYFKPLNFFLNKVEEKIQDKLSKYHVYIKDLIFSNDSQRETNKNYAYGYLSFNAYIDIKEEVDIDELLNKLNEEFKDYKVEIKQNKDLDSTNIKYQVILTFNVLLFRFWENFISTSLLEDDGFIQRDRNNINLYHYQNIQDNYFVIKDKVYKNDEHNILKRLVWYEYKKIDFSHNSYKFYEEDHFDYSVLTNNDHVIIIKDWIEIVNEEIIPCSFRKNCLYISFHGWKKYISYTVSSNDIQNNEYVIYDFSKFKIRKTYLRNEENRFRYFFEEENEDFSLIQVRNDIEGLWETKTISIPIKDRSISLLNQNEYIFNDNINRRKIFTSSVFSDKEFDLKNPNTTYNLSILNSSKLLYTHMWLKGIYQWVPFVSKLKKLRFEIYKNTVFEKNFYCYNANSRFDTQGNDYFSLWTYLSKERSRINKYLNTNLDNWKFWSFVFKKDFLSVED